MTFVARIETKLRSLSSRERLLLLLCALTVVAFFVVRWMVFPAVEEYRKMKGMIPGRREMLSRYQALQGVRDNVTESLAGMVDLLGKAEEGLLPGSDPSASGAALQGMLKPMVNRPDTRLTSVRTLAPVKKGEYVEVAVQMDMQTSTEGLASLLAGIPRQRKILRITKLSVSSGIYSAAMVNRPDVLMVSLVVAGMAPASEESGAQGGDRE